MSCNPNGLLEGTVRLIDVSIYLIDPVQDLGNDRYKMTLTIAEVTDDLFRKFRLEVDNDISAAEQTVQLSMQISAIFLVSVFI